MTTEDDMRFGYPYLLILVLLVPVVGLVGAYLRARGEKALTRLTANPPKSAFSSVQAALMLAGLALVLFASSRPQWGREMSTIERRSRNVVVAIDVSRSMLAEDVRPNRLDRAKMDVGDLIDSLASTNVSGRAVNDKCALVAFRNDARMVCPMTSDRVFLKQELSSISTLSAAPGATSLGAGIERALELIREDDGGEGEKADHSAIILISDGGDLEGRALDCADKAKGRGVPIFTIGIGDPNRESAIPAPGGGYVRDESGDVVKVKLETATLKTIAERSGGRYVPLATAQTAETTLGMIYRDFLRQVASKEQNEEEEKLGEKYQWFLVPGLALLLAGASLSRGRFRRTAHCQGKGVK